MRELFDPYRPRGDAQRVIHTAEDVINTYSGQGLRLTLRQLYYQFVANHGLPNTEKQYKRLGSIISRARLGGYLDWEAIEDRVRKPVVWQEYASVDDMLDRALEGFRLPRLRGQEVYVELWVEKDALAGVLQPIAAEYHVTLMVNRGYSSSSAMREAGERIRRKCDQYHMNEAKVLYLGDLDPSGEDMVRDIDERLDKFVNMGSPVDGTADLHMKTPIDMSVDKVALTMAQVLKYNPPPNPAKTTDARYAKFKEKFGSSSWEVDALPPNVLRTIIEDALEEVLDMEQMRTIIEEEEEGDAILHDALKKMKEVTRNG